MMLQFIHQGDRILLVKRAEGRRKFQTDHWLPRDLSTLTRAQALSVVLHLADKSLEELRHMQAVVYSQLEKIRVDYASQRAVGFYDAAVINLQEMDRHLATAIDLKEFGEE